MSSKHTYFEDKDGYYWHWSSKRSFFKVKVRPTLDEIKEQLATAISLGDDLTPTEVAEEAPVKLIYEFFDQFVKEESVHNQWATASGEQQSLRTSRTQQRQR